MKDKEFDSLNIEEKKEYLSKLKGEYLYLKALNKFSWGATVTTELLTSYVAYNKLYVDNSQKISLLLGAYLSMSFLTTVSTFLVTGLKAENIKEKGLKLNRELKKY